MGDTGYYYVPTACRQGASTTFSLALFASNLAELTSSGVDCKLIVAFHGCEMDIASIKHAFYTNSGLNEWAETNNVSDE